MNKTDIFIHNLYHTIKMLRTSVANQIALNTLDDDQLETLKEFHGRMLGCLDELEDWCELEDDLED